MAGPGTSLAREVDIATTLELGREFAGLESEMDPAPLLVLDLTEVTPLVSAGLSLLIDLKQRCEDAGVELVVAAGNRAVMRTLTTTGLTDYMTVVDSLEGALQRR